MQPQRQFEMYLLVFQCFAKCVAPSDPSASAGESHKSRPNSLCTIHLRDPAGITKHGLSLDAHSRFPVVRCAFNFHLDCLHSASDSGSTKAACDLYAKDR
jgi:hypothetical protein